jgi:GAF domain-containing protein
MRGYPENRLWGKPNKPNKPNNLLLSTSVFMTSATTSNFKLFQQIGRSIRRSMDPDEMLQNAVDAIGWHFGLDRCLVLSVDEPRHDIRITAQFNREPLKPVPEKGYALRVNSEWYRLLSEGKPVPLMDIQSESSSMSTPELDRFVGDTKSKSVIAFPLLNQGRLLGCLTMHYCQDGRSLSEDVLELGEAVAEELAGALRQASSFQEKLVDGRVFANSKLPLLVIEPDSMRILHHNDAALELLSPKGSLTGSMLAELFNQGEANRLKEVVRELTPWTAVVDGGELMLPRVEGQPLIVQVLLSSVSAPTGTAQRQVLLTLIPKKGRARPNEPSRTYGTENGGKGDDLVSSLSRQLNWERVTRQITSKLHSSLDRDTILQAAADSVGRAMKATACLIIRTDGPGSAMVTHEYADPNLSPLGLGRTGYLPLGAISAFKQRTTSMNDLASATKPPGLSRDEVNALVDNGIRALVGTPVTLHGIPYGVIIVESDEPRDWNPPELEMLETVATSAALALTNAHTYSQVKDNLFNMNLISNLTQQLTNALDQATRTGRPEKPVDAMPGESAATPLSVRELEVLKLIASGLANREIAQRLFLTESTVELHASRIRKKLKLKSRTALVKYACDNHLV